jgi:hypothetical protein
MDGIDLVQVQAREGVNIFSLPCLLVSIKNIVPGLSGLRSSPSVGLRPTPHCPGRCSIPVQVNRQTRETEGGPCLPGLKINTRSVSQPVVPTARNEPEGTQAAPIAARSQEGTNQVKYEEQQYVISLLSAGTSVDDAAEALVMRRAVAEVVRVAQDMQTQAGYAQEAAQRRAQWHYTLYAPEKPPVKIKSGGRVSGGATETDLYQRQARQAYKVLVDDLPAFCKDQKLDLAAMTEVVNGKRWEHKGWLCIWSGNQLDQGRQASPPNDLVDQAEREYQRGQEAAKTPRRQDSAYTVSPPVVVYAPKGK